MNVSRLKLMLYLIMGVNFVSLVMAQGVGTSVSIQLCGIVHFVQNIVGIFALALFLIGGVLYAVAHFLPAAGNIRSNIQSWAMGMLFAAIVALIIFMIAEPLISTITKIGGSATNGLAPNAISCT